MDYRSFGHLSQIHLFMRQYFVSSFFFKYFVSFILPDIRESCNPESLTKEGKSWITYVDEPFRTIITPEESIVPRKSSPHSSDWVTSRILKFPHIILPLCLRVQKIIWFISSSWNPWLMPSLWLGFERFRIKTNISLKV